MVLHCDLDDPTAPSSVLRCDVCETGQGWRCEVCGKCEVCDDCYNQKEGGGGIDHRPQLTNHPSNIADRVSRNAEAIKIRFKQFGIICDLPVHATRCYLAHCQHPNCDKLKGLFRHGIQCQVRAARGCVLCKKMWFILQLHARACKESDSCSVPRCRELTEHLWRQQQQSGARARATAMERMRQRAAELSREEKQAKVRHSSV